MGEVEEIKRRIDIVDLISSYLTLKKAGANYRALCPFHKEKTPSLMVSPEKQIWHCFGCGEGGDVFSFVMKMENLEFREALEMLAERSGVKLKKYQPKPQEVAQVNRKTRLFAVNLLAAQVFHKILIAHPAGKSALQYLKKRKLTDQTIKEFMIGYAPSSKVLHPFLVKKGFIDSEIQAAGSPDRFFRRIIFPITDVVGNVLGFTGRVLGPNQEPKYLNTPETIIFHKGRILYNLTRARGEIKLQKATVVVEGQMDVIASHQAGVKNVVASSGTALTPDHLQILYRYTPNIIFAFDADSAGLASAKKAYEMAIAEGFNVKMVELAGFKDPGEMIEKDPKLWPKAVAEAKPVIDWYFDLAFDQLTTKELSSQEKKEIAKEILPIIKKIPDNIEQAHYVGLLAKRLAVPDRVVFDALEKQKNPTPQKPVGAGHIKQLSSAELLLGILLLRPDKLKDATVIGSDDFLSSELAAIYSQLLKLYNQSKSSLESSKTRKEFIAKFKKTIDRQGEMKVDELILVVENLEKTDEELEEDLALTIKNIKNSQKETLKDFYAQEIKKAESAKDLERLKKLIKEFQDAIST